jgi:hypothetical protein
MMDSEYTVNEISLEKVVGENTNNGGKDTHLIINDKR